jgi:hypothetical protein
MAREEFSVRIKGTLCTLKIGENYCFYFKDSEETSFNSLRSEVMNTYWKDEDSGKTFFFIFVHEHNEDYLISDDELISVKLVDLKQGKKYKFIYDNGASSVGEFIELKKIGNKIHSIWIDFGRQPAYLNFNDIFFIEEINS